MESDFTLEGRIEVQRFIDWIYDHCERTDVSLAPRRDVLYQEYRRWRDTNRHSGFRHRVRTLDHDEGEPAS
jgi:hypothetical protein